MDRTSNILLVEDHRDTAEMFCRVLRAWGHGCEVAATVAEATALAARSRFDLLISDLSLPDGDGRDLMRALRAAHGLRGIAVTGHGYPADVASCAEAGFDRVLVKPVAMPQVRAAIAEVRSLPPLAPTPPGMGPGDASKGARE